MLIGAGNESTRSVTAHGMRLLMEHPEQLQMLIDKPEMIPDACEEILRYNPAFVCMRRTVMEDIEVAGVQMKEGDKLLLHWHLINQDDKVTNMFNTPVMARYIIFKVTEINNHPSMRAGLMVSQGTSQSSVIITTDDFVEKLNTDLNTTITYHMAVSYTHLTLPTKA